MCDVIMQPWMHQHLHPANIMLDDELLPQLSGIAIPTGSSQATIETDVYALGMIMLQLLTGRYTRCSFVAGEIVDWCSAWKCWMCMLMPHCRLKLCLS